MLHGTARLHVALGRMNDTGISTRGWTYNELVDGILAINNTQDPVIKMYRCIDCLLIHVLIEIDPRAVSYLSDLKRMI